MKDIANNELTIGDMVKILKSPYKDLIGKIVKVIHSDNPNKVKVSYSQNWQGYYNPNDVVKMKN